MLIKGLIDTKGNYLTHLQALVFSYLALAGRVR